MMIPMNRLTAIKPSISSVVAALRDLGFRKAGTPLLIASTPVSAAHPDENARATRNTNAKPMMSPCSACSSKPADSARSGVAEDVQLEEAPRQHQVHADHERVRRNRESGARLADSAQVHRRQQQIATTANTVLCCATNGSADPMLLIAEDIDTATVST